MKLKIINQDGTRVGSMSVEAIDPRVAQLEAELEKSVQANVMGLGINESLQAENERLNKLKTIILEAIDFGEIGENYVTAIGDWLEEGE